MNFLRSIFNKNFRTSLISKYSVELIRKNYMIEIELEEIYESIFEQQNDLAA